MSTEAAIIPTGYRSKIAQTLSYPIGAEAISAVFREAPQFAEFEITFRGAWGIKHQAADAQEVLTIAYSRSANSISMSNSERSQQRLDGKWEIFVLPVNRVQKHLIKEKLIAALPQALPWLQRRAILLLLVEIKFPLFSIRETNP
jgi:hypothetical protein